MSPNISPRVAQEAPYGPQEGPKICPNRRFTLFLTLPFWASMLEGLGKAIWGPFGAPLGPILGHLGAILGPSWGRLGAILRQLGVILGHLGAWAT